MIGEVVAQFVGEVLCYGTGRMILSIMTPGIRIPKTAATHWPRKTARSWFALTYTRDGSRYYYDETVTLVGLLFSVAIVIAIVVGVHASRT
jgi:hypothetical protein